MHAPNLRIALGTRNARPTYAAQAYRAETTAKNDNGESSQAKAA
jgi:hypothetical protein